MQLSNPQTNENRVQSDDILWTDQRRKAFGELGAAALGTCAAVVFIGPRGVGKSSLINAWEQQSQNAFHLIDLAVADGEPDQIVASLASELDVDTADLGRSAILSAVKEQVQIIRDRGRETIVLVEDADAVSSNTVELLLMLARNGTSKRPLLKYIFTGTDALREQFSLDSGAARRKKFVVVELEGLPIQQSIDFLQDSAASLGDFKIAEDAAAYLHDKTDGIPGNMTTILAEIVAQMSDQGEKEITGARAREYFDQSSKVVVSDAIIDAQDGADQANSTDQPVDGIRGNSELPSSINEVSDPRPLLRWAFGLDQHSETEALSARSLPASSRPNGAAAPAPTKEELNEALKKVAEREAAQRDSDNESVLTSVDTSLVKDPSAVKPDLFKRANEENIDVKAMASKTVTDLNAASDSEAFRFGDHGPGVVPLDVASEAAVPVSATTEAVARTPLEDPETLKAVLSARPQKKSGGKFLFLAGAGVMAAAAIGMVWTFMSSPTSTSVGPANSVAQTGSDAPVSNEPAAVVAETKPTSVIVTTERAPSLPSEVPALANPSVDVAWADLSSTPNADSTNTLFGDGGVPGKFSNSFNEKQFGEHLLTAQAITADIRLASIAAIDREEAQLVAKVDSIKGEAEREASRLLELQTEVSSVSSDLGALAEQKTSDQRTIDLLRAQVEEKEKALVALQTELEGLTATADDASNRVELEQDNLDVVTSQMAFLTRNRVTAANELDQTSAAIETAEQNLATLNGNIEIAQVNLAAVEQELGTRRQDVTLLDQQTAEAAANLETLKQQRIDVETEIETARAELSAIEGQMSEVELASLNANSAASERTVELETLATQKAAAENELGTLQAEIEAMQLALDAADKELESLFVSQGEKANFLTVLETKIVDAQTELEAATTSIETAVAELDVKRADLVAVETVQADAQSKLDATLAEVSTLSRRVELQTASLETLKAERTEVSEAAKIAQETAAERTARIEELNAKVSDAETRLATAEANLNSTVLAFNNAGQKQGEIAAEVEAKQGVLNALDADIASRQDVLAELNSQQESLILAERGAKDVLSKLEAQEADQQAALASVSAEVATLQAALEANKAAVSDVTLEADAVRTVRDAMTAEVEALQSDLVARRDELAQTNASVATSQAQLTQISTDLDAARELSEGEKIELATIEQERKAIVAEREALNADVTTARQALDEISSEVSVLEEQSLAAKNELEDFVAVRANAQTELLAIQGDRDATAKDLGELQAQLAAKSVEISDKETELVALLNKLGSTSAAVQTQIVQLDSLKAQEASFGSETAALEQALDGRRTEYQALTNEIESLESERSTIDADLAKSVELMDATRGNLGRLISNKDGLESDISTAVQRLETLRGEEASKRADVASLQASVSEKEQQLAALNEQISVTTGALQAAASKRDLLDQDVLQQETETAKLLVQKQTELSELSALIDQRASALELVTSDLNARQASLEQMQQRESQTLSSLQVATSELRDKQAALLATENETASLASVQTVDEPVAKPVNSSSFAVRDADQVFTAIAEAPGLGRVSDGDKQALQTALVRGDCVNDALKSTFGRVNPHTLVALLQNMEMCGS